MCPCVVIIALRLLGFLARKQLDRKHAAALRIQANYRGIKARRKYNKLWTQKQAEEEKALQAEKKEKIAVLISKPDKNRSKSVQLTRSKTKKKTLQRSKTKKRQSMKRTGTMKKLAEAEEQIAKEGEKNKKSAELMSIFTAVSRNDIPNLKNILARDGQDVDERHPRSGQTALMLAATKGFTEAIVVLLDGGANRNIIMPDGTTALLLAALKSNDECLAALVNSETREPMEQMALDSQLHDDGCTALHICVENVELGNITVLLKAGADPNVTDTEGCTCVVVAVSADPDDLEENERHITLEIVKALLQSKGDPNMADVNGATPLAASIQLGFEPICRALLEYNANPYTRDHNDEIPLQQVIAEPQSSVKLLNTIIEFVTLEGTIEAGLMSQPAPRKSVLHPGPSPLDVRLFEENQILLMLAVLNKRLDLAIALVKAGCSYWLRDNTHSGILDFARAVYEKDPKELGLPDDKALAIACEENDAEQINALISTNLTRPHFLDANGMSPLMYACYAGSADAVKALLAHVEEDLRDDVADVTAGGTGMFALILATYGMAGTHSKVNRASFLSTPLINKLFFCFSKREYSTILFVYI